MKYTIGVDLGGTNLRAGLVDPQGNIVLDTRVETRVEEGPQSITNRIVGLITQVHQQVPTGGQVVGVGVCVPGPLDPFAGFVYTMPNIKGFDNTPLRQILADATGLDIELGNDANAAAVGEWIFGAGKGLRDLVYVTVSTGIGGGVWEDTASGPGFARRAAIAMQRHPESLLHHITTVANVQGHHIADAAAQGDAVALQLMDEEGEAIGAGLVNMLHLYSPAKIVLGGGVVINNPTLVHRARQVIAERAIESYRDVPVVITDLGDKIGLLGAAALYGHMRERR